MGRVKISGMKKYMPAIGIFVAIALLYLFVPGVKFLPWTAERIAGAILVGMGYVLVTLARVQLGDSFSVQPEAKGLVTHGLYARIRNPMYVFLDLMIFGLALVLQLYWLLAILAGLAVFQTLQAGREAKVLQEKFGKSYSDYREHTWF